MTKEQYRIQDVQKAVLNGVKVKLFKAFEYDAGAKAYIFCGQFSAPIKTSNKNLEQYIGGY